MGEAENDQTGDSGMGSGSGSGQYGAVNEWKRAIRHPPPGIIVLS